MWRGLPPVFLSFGRFHGGNHVATMPRHSRDQAIRAGTAAAMQGFIQMSGGAMGVFAVSGLQAHLPLLAMPTVMLACVLLSASVFTLGLSTARRAPIQA